MKKSVLVNVSYIIDINENSKLSESEALNKVKNSLARNVTIDSKTHLKWEGISLVELNEKNANCGRCQKCGTWVTDREKNNCLEGLSDGATYEGKLLCDECLPDYHKWAY